MQYSSLQHYGDSRVKWDHTLLPVPSRGDIPAFTSRQLKLVLNLSTKLAGCIPRWYTCLNLPSVLWHCWLGIRKSIRPVKNEWWGTGVVICLECGANDLHMVWLMPLPPIVSCFSKIQNGLPFWCRLTQVAREKMPLNVYVYTCSKMVTCSTTNLAERRATYYVQPTMLPVRQTTIHQPVHKLWPRIISNSISVIMFMEMSHNFQILHSAFIFVSFGISNIFW